MAGSQTPDAHSSSLHDFSSDSKCEPFDLPESLNAGEATESGDRFQSFDPSYPTGPDFFWSVKPGDIVGNRYKILSLIAVGGMGVVYKVEQIYLGKVLALKVLSTRCVSDLTVRRFQHEARAAFGIDHPSLISVHDFGLLDEKVPFLVMDYVKGQSLAERIKSRGTLSVEEAVPIFLRICFGLEYAHRQGVIHRDMKPSNIMLVENMSAKDEGSLKIVDFGIAKFTQLEKNDIQALTRTGEVFGSPLYMSPEQCSGSPVDQRSDIYSLGCVFFEALTGTTPFLGANALTTMMQHMGEKAPSLKEASMGKVFPPLFEQIIAKMLAKSVGDRYQSLAQVAGDLAALERSLEDPHLLANTVLVEERAKKPVRKKNSFEISRVGFCVLITCLIVLSAVISSLITSRFSGKSDARSAVVDAQRDYADMQVQNADEVKKFVKSLEPKKPKLSASLKAILTAIKQQDESHKLKLKFINIGEAAMKAIVQARWVHSLDLMGCVIDNSKVIDLAQLPNLTHLTLSYSNLDDMGASGVARCQSLQELTVSWSNITDKSIPYFTAMKSLKRLEIGGIALTPLSMRFLAEKHELQHLLMRAATGITDESFVPMMDANLTFINVESIDIGDRAAFYLSRMRNLHSIAIGLTRITPDGVEQLLSNKNLQTIMYVPTESLKEVDVRILAMKYPRCHFVNTLQKGDLIR